MKLQVFFSFMDIEMYHLKQNGSMGTYKNYACTKRSFERFLSSDLAHSDVMSQELIISYETWLKKQGVTRNTTSFYMRILRAVYNKAGERQQVLLPSPFNKVYTGIDRTHKRAVEENVIVLLKQMDLSNSRTLSFTRDLFIFSFYTRGMAFVDIAFLKKSNIKNGFIQYVRRKTGQPMFIKLEQCMQEIIERYAPRTSNSLYLFPLLTEYEDDLAYKQYQNWLSYYNKQLKRLSTELNLSQHLTSYVSRHTWATIARNRNIPLSVISAGMGHTSETTTRIYLATLDTAVVDDANRMIIAAF